MYRKILLVGINKTKTVKRYTSIIEYFDENKTTEKSNSNNTKKEYKRKFNKKKGQTTMKKKLRSGKKY